MPAFLLLLFKVNLAMAAAVGLIAVLRRPLRLGFGAPVTYAIWLLVPVAALASLLPPRAAAPMPAHLPMYVPVAPVGHVAPSIIAEQLTGQSAVHALAAPVLTFATAVPELLFAVWVLGVLSMGLHLARLQGRFHAAVRRGQTGPAVLGFLRPRIVTPDGFAAFFTPQEQAAILAHERVHLARQDARINALAALLRCLCWFNPLIHLGARWMRIDQELACDATVVAQSVSRSDYANALLKSQMMVSALPLGCNWPGSQHPLIERVAMLKRKQPGAARRLAGAGLVLFAASVAGLGAWAAQPPVAANASDIATHPIVQAKESIKAVSFASRNAVHHLAEQVARASEPLTKASRSEQAIHGDPAVPEAAPDRADAAKGPEPEKLSPPSADLSALPPAHALMPPTVLASASPVVARNDRAAVARPSVQTPRNRTDIALRCWLGLLDNQSCWKSDGCNRGDGPVERVDYLGSNATGADIYEVRYMHSNAAYVVAPDPEGKTSEYVVQAADPYWIKRDISSRAAPTPIYTRSADAPPAGCRTILGVEQRGWMGSGSQDSGYPSQSSATP